MINRFEIYKGIPVGSIIKRDLKKRGLSQISLAHAIGVPYKNLNKILNNHRLINTTYAEKIESFLDYEPNLLIRLQDYIIKKKFTQKKVITHGEIPKIRQCVFWDIDMQSLDWLKHKNFIIERAKKYGNQKEKEAVAYFYSYHII